MSIPQQTYMCPADTRFVTKEKALQLSLTASNTALALFYKRLHLALVKGKHS